jgi:hypothetical protein
MGGGAELATAAPRKAHASGGRTDQAPGNLCTREPAYSAAAACAAPENRPVLGCAALSHACRRTGGSARIGTRSPTRARPAAPDAAAGVTKDRRREADALGHRRHTGSDGCTITKTRTVRCRSGKGESVTVPAAQRHQACVTVRRVPAPRNGCKQRGDQSS